MRGPLPRPKLSSKTLLCPVDQRAEGRSRPKAEQGAVCMSQGDGAGVGEGAEQSLLDLPFPSLLHGWEAWSGHQTAVEELIFPLGCEGRELSLFFLLLGCPSV
ncbi:unnamed protein product [Natator depressus]